MDSPLAPGVPSDLLTKGKRWKSPRPSLAEGESKRPKGSPGQLLPNNLFLHLPAGATSAASLALPGRHVAVWLSHHLTQVVGISFAILVLLAVLVARATWTTLRSRQSYVALPTSSCDPAVEEVARFAHVLSRTRRSVRGWGTRKAESLRFRLANDERGRVTQYLEGTPRALALAKAGLPAEVELKEVPKATD